jgi:hypothetical protein
VLFWWLLRHPQQGTTPRFMTKSRNGLVVVLLGITPKLTKHMAGGLRLISCEPIKADRSVSLCLCGDSVMSLVALLRLQVASNVTVIDQVFKKRPRRPQRRSPSASHQFIAQIRKVVNCLIENSCGGMVIL